MLSSFFIFDNLKYTTMSGNYTLILLSVLTLSLVFPSRNHAQVPSRRDIYLEYIDAYANVAIREMKLYHIPASITLSQALIESGAGRGELAVKANNHFGIKCHQDWTGDTYTLDDDAPNECFRKYKSAEESFRDHSLFLTQKPRYASLFKLDITDYKGWAYGLKQAGYATNPRYAEMLIKVIDDYTLNKYDETEVKLPPRNIKIEKPSRAAIVYTYYHPGYIQPGPENFTYVEEGKSGRKIYLNNNTLFVFANRNDSYLSIGSDLNIRAGKLARLNEMKRNEPLAEGQIVYIERKKLNGIRDNYTVQPNDTWYSISQFTGVQIKVLKELNKIEGDSIPTPGKELILKGHVKRSFFQRLFGRQ
ncbi:MAG: glucosaminidase domain-containing protein [Bacteroidota bacterium]|nr:glucosaminidase domain-containing protein [Bacteroidota bacterium]